MTSLVCRSESMCSPCTTTRWAYYMYMFILQNILSQKSNSSKIRGRGISGRWNFIRAKSFDTHSRYEITKVGYRVHQVRKGLLFWIYQQSWSRIVKFSCNITKLSFLVTLKVKYSIVFDAVALKYPFSNAKFQNVIWDVEKLIWKKKYIQGKFWNAICLVDRMHECCGWENELIIDKNNNKKYNEANH